MDNQYNYYRPDSDENRGADNQQGFGAGPQKDPKTSKPKKGYMKKVALVVGAAVLFGAVGGVTMQGTSYLTGKLLGKNTKSTVGTTKTVSNAKLTTSTSTVTSDVSDIVENTLPSIVSITNMSVQEVQNFFGGTSQQESESAGSGIIISQNDSELLVVTNNHVVEGSDTLTVTFNDDAFIIVGISSLKVLPSVAYSIFTSPGVAFTLVKTSCGFPSYIPTYVSTSSVNILLSDSTSISYPFFFTINVLSSFLFTSSNLDGTLVFKNSSKVSPLFAISYSVTICFTSPFATDSYVFAALSFACFINPSSPTSTLTVTPASISITTIVITNATSVIPSFFFRISLMFSFFHPFKYLHTFYINIIFISIHILFFYNFHIQNIYICTINSSFFYLFVI